MSAASRVASPRAVNIADLRAIAQARLPKVAFDYMDGGAEAEVTLRENMRVYGDWLFRPRGAVYVPAPDLSVTVMGQRMALPFILSPIGYSKLLHPEGERGAARAAGRAGTGYAMSTICGYSLEEVARAAGGAPLFYQVYLLGGRAAGEATIERARAAGYKGLFLTIDTAVSGMRERDWRNGMAALMGRNPFAKLPYLPDILAHPRWLARYLIDPNKLKVLPNVVVPGEGPFRLFDVAKALESSVVTWDDFKWIRAQWKGAIAVKGLLTGEDARRAAGEGADAVVVSNHAGRQLDGVAASLAALPEVLEAVGGQVEVLMDGGIRRGGDIVKAMALGAKAVLVGRAYAYGMAAAGEAGIDRAIAILRADLLRTLKLLGCAAVTGLNASHLQRKV